jgi:hypothetical protein
MTSPDWSEYVDLTPYDLSAVDIFNEAITEARTKLPEWVPYAGSIEVVLLEAIATEAANMVAAANRVPGATTETLLKLFGVERSDGTKATTTITVVAINTAGYTISSGTNFAYFPPDDRDPVVYTTTADLVIPNGSASGTVDAEAAEVGTASNEPSSGAAVQVLETIPYVKSSTLASKPSGGLEAESDTEFFQRAINTLQSYSAAASTSSQIESVILTDHNPPAWRAKAFNLERESDRDTSASGWVAESHPGYVLVAVAKQNADSSDSSDIPLSASELQAIADDINDRSNASLVVDVVNAEVVDVAITITVYKKEGFQSATVASSIESTLDGWLDPNSWDWNQVVRINDVIALVDQVDGVDYVSSVGNITTTSANASNSGAGTDLDLHLLGSLTIPNSSSYSITVL